jgi:flagellar motor switch protein FliG
VLVKGALEREAIARTSRTVAGYTPAHVRGALAGEPPHAAAAIISALPTATAAAVLELYPPHEREAIVKRMQRPRGSAIPSTEELFAQHG